MHNNNTIEVQIALMQTSIINGAAVGSPSCVVDAADSKVTVSASTMNKLADVPSTNVDELTIPQAE